MTSLALALLPLSRNQLSSLIPSHFRRRTGSTSPRNALAHRAEKWTRFSAPNDAPLEEESIGWIPKVESTFGSDALALRVAAILLAAGVTITTAEAAETTRFPAMQHENVILSVHAATDQAAMEPLIRDFQALSPNVTVEYTEYLTNELFIQATAVCEGKQESMDLVLSSSVDHLVKLVNDGCAARYRSPTTLHMPSWTRWRDEVFGFTFEPAVIVFNKDLVPPEDVRRTRAELIDLLRSKPETYQGKIGTYDVSQSGIGYLFASYDARGTTVFGRLLEALGRAQVVTSCCTTDLLSDLSAGRLAIGYNLIGSYAIGAVRRGAPLRVVIPRDYTVVLSRAAFVPRMAREAATGFRFLDYLLSARGQQKSREASFYFSADLAVPEEVDGPMWLSSSGLLRPIAIGPELLAVQDRAKRERLLAEWRRSTSSGANSP
jgi:iron(III) transport system substrate-binding protein